MFGIGKEYDYSLIRTTSKEALKRSALLVCGNDIKKATELYDFFVKDMPDLPTTDPVLPSTLEQMRDTALGIFQWGEANQDKIVGVINVIMGMMGKQPISIPTLPVEVPPAPPIGG